MNVCTDSRLHTADSYWSVGAWLWGPCCRWCHIL